MHCGFFGVAPIKNLPYIFVGEQQNRSFGDTELGLTQKHRFTQKDAPQISTNHQNP